MDKKRNIPDFYSLPLLPLIFCSARFLLLNIHPVGIGVIFYVIAFLGLFYSVGFILKTGCTDPGIIPRARPDEIEYMMAQGDVGKPPLIISAAKYLPFHFTTV